MPIYKDLKRNSWFVQTTLTLENGQKKTIKKRGFKTKKEAKAYEQSSIINISPFEDMTIQEMYDAYMEKMKMNWKPTTLRNKNGYFHRNILPILGKLKFKDVDTLCLYSFTTQLKNEGKSAYDLFQTKNTLNALFHFWQKEDPKLRNPAQEMTWIDTGKAKTRFNIWTLEEFQHFIQSGYEDKMAVIALEILFYGGLRKSELQGLTPRDFDFKKSCISINKIRYRIDQKIYVLDPKTTQSNRMIYIPTFLSEEIEAYLASLILDPDSYIFPLNERYLREAIQYGVRILNLPQIRIHDFRHSCASLMIHMGYPYPVIAKHLGHTNARITLDVYSHIYKKEEIRLAKELNMIMQNLSVHLIQYPIIVSFNYHIYRGIIPDFPDCAYFSSNSLEDLRRMARNLIQEEIQKCKEQKKKLPDPTLSKNLSFLADDLILYESFDF